MKLNQSRAINLHLILSNTNKPNVQLDHTSLRIKKSTQALRISLDQTKSEAYFQYF